MDMVLPNKKRSRSTMNMYRDMKLTLISSNDKIFKDVNLGMMMSESPLIKSMVEKDLEEGFMGESKVIIRVRDTNCFNTIAFSFPNVTGKILEMVLNYCSKEYKYQKDVKGWVAANLNEIDDITLAHFITAVSDLRMCKLMERACKVICKRDLTESEIVRIYSSKLDE